MSTFAFNLTFTAQTTNDYGRKLHVLGEGLIKIFWSRQSLQGVTIRHKFFSTCPLNHHVQPREVRQAHEKITLWQNVALMERSQKESWEAFELEHKLFDIILAASLCYKCRLSRYFSQRSCLTVFGKFRRAGKNKDPSQKPEFTFGRFRVLRGQRFIKIYEISRVPERQSLWLQSLLLKGFRWWMRKPRKTWQNFLMNHCAIYHLSGVETGRWGFLCEFICFGGRWMKQKSFPGSAEFRLAMIWKQAKFLESGLWLSLMFGMTSQKIAVNNLLSLRNTVPATISASYFLCSFSFSFLLIFI